MQKLAALRKIKNKFRNIRNLIFAANYMKKLAVEKKAKLKSAVSPRSVPDP
jgi:hypothetical protein